MTFFLWVLDTIQRYFTGFLGIDPERAAGFRARSFLQSPKAQRDTTWFHASSFGELEMLSPLIEDMIAQGLSVGVSAFSPSALSALKAYEGRTVFSGLSPSERGWDELFTHFNVKRFVLAKYDFWPGMLHACALREIPMIIINAQWRSSLRWMRLLFRALGARFPDFFFSANSPEHEKRLQKVFPSSHFLTRIDPRYERVLRRSRGRKKLPDLSRYPKPWGIVGSAWIDDLEIILQAIHEWNGTLVVVPHSLQPENLKLIHELCEAKREGRFVLVSEMGILAELYGQMDWAFVGGGFHSGIHSTIEPAVFGIPVACGPKRVNEFSETRELMEAGILTVCRDPYEVEHWLNAIAGKRPGADLFREKSKRYVELLEETLKIGVN